MLPEQSIGKGSMLPTRDKYKLSKNKELQALAKQINMNGGDYTDHQFTISF